MSDPDKARISVIERIANVNQLGDHRYADDYFADEVLPWCRDCGLPSSYEMCNALDHTRPGAFVGRACQSCIDNHPPCPTPNGKFFDPSECNCDECDPEDCDGGCICETVGETLTGVNPKELVNGYEQSFRDYMSYYGCKIDDKTARRAAQWFIEQSSFVLTQGIREAEGVDDYE